MIKVKCLKCSYEWNTKSEMLMVSCPCCSSKVKINREIKDEELIEEE